MAKKCPSDKREARGKGRKRKERLITHFRAARGLNRLCAAHTREDGRMSITDELREWAEGDTLRAGMSLRTARDQVLAIADSIDKAHEEALREAYTAGRGDGMGMTNAKDAQAEYLRGRNDGYDEGYDAGFASADDWCAQHEGAMAEHGWYRALDADKQPIKFGDEVEWRNPCGSCELRHGIVTGIKTDYVDGELFYEIIVNVDGFTVRLMSNILHHYRTPEPDTWERIIEDAMMGADRDGAPDTYQGCMDELVARCKALAGDAK